MKRHLAGKLFIGFFGMALLTVGLLWLIQAVIMKDSYLNERVRTISTSLQNEAQKQTVNYEELEETLSVSLISVSSSGEVLYMSDGIPMRGMLLKHIRPQSLNTEDVVFIRASKGARYALVGIPFSGGALYAVFSLLDVDEAARILLGQLWIITTVLFVSAVAFALMLTRMFSRPIIRVTQAARDMAQGRFDVTLPVRSHDEIGQLTTALNELGTELSKTENLRRELIANVSHELRAPLSVIQGFAETVRDVTWPDAEKRTGQLTIIAEEASRLSRIVGDMLNFAKLQAGVSTLTPSVFAVCPVLNDILGLHEMDAQAKHLRLELDCSKQSVRFDKEKFLQVVGNLLSNAINHATPDTAVIIQCESHDDRCRVCVRNTGDTIPKEELGRIWERFYRSSSGSSPQMGTGLGLSIVKSILDSHAVSYGVDSHDLQTVFWFETMPPA